MKPPGIRCERLSPISEKARPPIAERLADRELIDAAIRKAVREAVLAHARAGQPVATWRDGKVVWLQPAEIFAIHGTPEGSEQRFGRPSNRLRRRVIQEKQTDTTDLLPDFELPLARSGR